MIPIIFDKSEPGKGNDAFKTNGLGRLSDAISCDVTKSLDGSQYDLDLEYPVTGLNYDYLIERNYIYTTVSHKYGPQPFRINKISKPIDGKVTVNAQHISYILKKTLIRPYLGESEMDAATRFRIHKGQTLQSVLDDMVNYIQPAKNRLFNFTTNCQVVAGMAFNPYDKTWYEKSGWGTGGSGDDVYYQIDKPISVQEFLTGDDSNSINSIFGFSEEDNTQLEYVFDGLTIALYAKVGVDSGISIRYGKDLTDLTYDVDIDDSYGYAIPYYSGSRTSTTIIGPVVNKNVDGTDAFGEIELIDLSSDETYGSYLDRDGGSETPTPANAADWISQKMADETPWVTKQNVTISFVELWKTEEYKNVAPLQKLDLGDTVTVIYPDLGVHVTKRIQNENWDSLVDRYTSMTLGDLREDIADVILDGVESYLGQISEYVDEVSTYFTTEINRTAYEISLKADASTVTTLGAVVAQNTAAITETSNAIEAEVTRAEGAESNLSTIISQKADSISISVNNSTDSATLTIGLYSGNDLVDSVTSSAIQFTGDIVFASDLVDGTTQISGNNITTGLISADRIDVDNLTVDKLVTKYNTNRALASSLTIRDGIIYQTSNPPSGRFDGTYIGMPLGSSVDLSGEYGVIMRVSESSYVSVSSTEVSMSTPGYLSVYISNNDLAVRIGTYLIECSKPIEINGYDVLTTNSTLAKLNYSTTTAGNIIGKYNGNTVSASFSAQGFSGSVTGSKNPATVAYVEALANGISNKGYLTSHQSLSGYATQTWVTNKGYLTSHQSLSGYLNSIGSASWTEISSNTWVVNSFSLNKSGSSIYVSGNHIKKNLSDARLKENIADLNDFESVYMDLRPVRFNYKDLPGLEKGTKYGFIAQEIEASMVKNGMFDESLIGFFRTDETEDDAAFIPYVGERGYLLDYEKLHALHVQMIQKHHHEIESLKQENVALKGEIDILKQQIQQIKEEIQNGNN